MAQVPKNMPQVEVIVDQFCVGQFDGLQKLNEIMLVSDVFSCTYVYLQASKCWICTV